MRGAVERVVLDLITGGRSTPDIKRALLSHSPQLAGFFGRRDINDVLLPLLITCLNAGSWQLRGAFFGAVAGIGPYGGRDSLDVFLLPCLEQVRGGGEGGEGRGRQGSGPLCIVAGPLRVSLGVAVHLIGHHSNPKHGTQQALVDQEAAVVADAVGCVAAVARHLRKRNLLAAAKKVRFVGWLFTFLAFYPAAAVRSFTMAKP